MIIIFAQKYGLSEGVNSALKDYLKEDYIVFSIMYDHTNFDTRGEDVWQTIPKSLKFSDIPYTDTPSLVLNRRRKIVMSTPELGSFRVSNLEPDFLDGHELVYCGDLEGHYLSNFVNLMNTYGNPSKVSCMNLQSVTKQGYRESFDNRVPFYFESRILKLSYIDRRMDYLFFINGMVLFSKMRYLFRDNKFTNITKENIQFLYKLRDEGECNLNAWEGKKYPETFFPLSIANRPKACLHCTFMLNFIENLASAGLINPYEKKAHFLATNVVEINQPLYLTETGKAFLAHLHPDCKDYDLFGRMRTWSELSYEEIDNKINSYIRQYFGKQKRFMKSL